MTKFLMFHIETRFDKDELLAFIAKWKGDALFGWGVNKKR